MPTHKRVHKRAFEVWSRFRSLFRTRGTKIISLIALIISALYLSYQATRVVAAMSVWADLKAADSDSSAVDEALRRLNEEEAKLIMPFGITLLCFAAAFHSVKLKIIPRRCFYCRKWAQAKNVKQTPDRAFYYHEECEATKRKQRRIIEHALTPSVLSQNIDSELITEQPKPT